MGYKHSMRVSGARKPREPRRARKMPNGNYNTTAAGTVLIFASIMYLVMSFQPLTKEQQMKKFDKLDQGVEPFRKNLSECARQVKASMTDIEMFLKRMPQTRMEGKCFVACILKRNAVITNNKITKESLLEMHRTVYGDHNEVLKRLEGALHECMAAVEKIFEICEFASVFNDCMNIKMEHVLENLDMERRMEEVGRMTENPSEWTDVEDDLLKLVKDEL